VFDTCGKSGILSYIVGEERRCRSELDGLIKRIADLELALTAQGKELDENQKRLRRRMFLLFGNTYFVEADFEKAESQYVRAWDLAPKDYYAMASVAQCRQALRNPASVTDWARCLEEIDRSGDFNRKRERVTKTLISVLAVYGSKGSDNRPASAQWLREVHDLLSGNLTIDGLTPKFFSPGTKRLVSASELLAEANDLPFATP
jgi:hypothetical protein